MLHLRYMDYLSTFTQLQSWFVSIMYQFEVLTNPLIDGPNFNLQPYQGSKLSHGWCPKSPATMPWMTEKNKSTAVVQIWGGSTNWDTQNGWFVRGNPTKCMILGYPYFRKPPNMLFFLMSKCQKNLRCLRSMHAFCWVCKTQKRNIQ